MPLRSAVPLLVAVTRLLSFAAVGAATPTEDAAALIARAIEFHGGPIFRQSETRLQVCSRSGCFSVRSSIDEGLFDIEAAGRVRDGHRRVRVTNDSVQLWLDGVEQAVSEERQQALRNWVMARAYFVYLPYRLQDDSVLLTDLGTELWSGRQLRKVKVSFVPGSSSGADDEFLYWFDPQTARLEQFAYSFAGDPGGVRFRRAFNYRRVGGLLFYDQENWGVDGEGLVVEDATPAAVGEWTLISTVTLSDLRVEPLRP